MSRLFSKCIPVPGRVLVLWLISLCVALAAVGCDRPTQAERRIDLLGGAVLPEDQWRGGWLFVNYWAEWCAPCRVEIPEFNELSERDDVAVVGVNFDELSGPELEAAVANMGIGFPVAVRDPRALWDAPWPQVLPTTLVVAPDGTLAQTLIGPQTRDTLLRAISEPR